LKIDQAEDIKCDLGEGECSQNDDRHDFYDSKDAPNESFHVFRHFLAGRDIDHALHVAVHHGHVFHRN
jgi:hypothetical protein